MRALGYLFRGSYLMSDPDVELNKIPSFLLQQYVYGCQDTIIDIKYFKFQLYLIFCSIFDERNSTFLDLSHEKH